MKIRLFLSLLLIPLVAGCGESRLNPFNWGGRTQEILIRTPDGGAGNPSDLVTDDPRPLIDQVIGVQIDPTPTGAILTARGLPPTQGYWLADLVRVPPDRAPAGTLAFVFKAVPDPTPQPAGTQRSREVVVATTLSRGDFNGVNTVLVVADRNQMSARR